MSAKSIHSGAAASLIGEYLAWDFPVLCDWLCPHSSRPVIGPATVAAILWWLKLFDLIPKTPAGSTRLWILDVGSSEVLLLGYD